MTLLSKNTAKGTYFLADPSERKVVQIKNPVAKGFLKHQRQLNIKVVTLPSLKEVKQFRKLVEQGVLDDIPADQHHTYWETNYPELFI